MPNNYVLLERIELNASAASVTFANIPQTGYTDLKIVCSVRSDRTSATWDYINLTLNGSSSSYSYRYISGNGSAAASGSLSLLYGGDIPATGATSSTFCNSEFYIPNYGSTTTAKSISFDLSAENNATAGFLYLGAGLWNPGTQAAVTSITLTSGNAVNFVANSTFSLYGLAATGTTPTIAPKASGGNVIDYDGTYWIHTFNTNGTFTPQTGLTCDFLVVAGGGGGASGGGGGGAGGYRTSVGTSGRNSSAESALSIASGIPIAVTVGAGGAGGAGVNDSRPGVIGSDSVFSTITSNGGGRGGSYLVPASAAGNGGSGGGTFSSSYAIGNGTANQGFDSTAAFRGGGAGVGGTNSTYSGGAGLSSSITGTSVARGGGGASSGDQSGQPTGTATAGGGAAATAFTTNSAGAGTANTGGGGGSGGGKTGTDNPGNGGAGGSGIVIIRYLAS